jgi:hypothetical protein
MAASYVGVLIASRLTADANIPFDERILAPFILLVMIGVSLAVGRAWHGWGLLLRGTLAALFVVSSFEICAVPDRRRSRPSHASTTKRACCSRCAAKTRFPCSTPIYLTGRRRSISASQTRAGLLTRATSPLRTFGDTLAKRGAVIVAFDAFSPDCIPPDSGSDRRTSHDCPEADGTFTDRPCASWS